MPIVTCGLLSVLEQAGLPARARWDDALIITVDADAKAAAQAIADAPTPDIDALSWPTRRPQALGPSLREADNPLFAYRTLVADAGPTTRRLLRAVATDQALDSFGCPLRTRLLRGAKSDLSPFRDWGKLSPEALQEELEVGPTFKSGQSGRCLGLVPEVHTFGGTVGREPSEIGASSELLAVLLRHGIIALPPIGISMRNSYVVGGPLLTSNRSQLSWPQWSLDCGAIELRALYSMREIHSDRPDAAFLRQRGITAVYRSTAQKLSTTGEVFRWGERVA